MIPIYLTSVNGLQPTAENDALDECIARIAVGDNEALSQLYCEVKASVYGYALSILKSAHDAEDILHDCFLSIHGSASSYQSSGKPMAWIMTITRNLCMMKLRENARARQNHSDIPEEDWDTHADISHRVSYDDRMIIAECLRTLSDDERQIVVLHVAAGLKHREIAAHMDIALPTVLSKYHRALKKLKIYMERGEEQNEGSFHRTKNKAGI